MRLFFIGGALHGKALEIEKEMESNVQDGDTLNISTTKGDYSYNVFSFKGGFYLLLTGLNYRDTLELYIEECLFSKPESELELFTHDTKRLN